MLPLLYNRPNSLVAGCLLLPFKLLNHLTFYYPNSKGIGLQKDNALLSIEQ